MAFILLQLKVAIQRRHRGGSSTAQAILLWGRWLVALALGAAAGAGIAFLEASSSAGDIPVLLIFTVFWAGWIVLPLAIPGMGDTSVDPARLEMYPISPGQQVAGFALGGLFAPTAFFTFLTASGGAFVPEEAVVARTLAVVVALLYTLLCVVGSRSVMAAVSGAASTRHGRDVVFIVAGALFLGMFFLFNAAQDFLSDLAGLENSTLAAILEWTPPGAFAAAITSIRQADYMSALLRVGYGVVWIVAFSVLWAWAIRRRVKGGGRGSEARRRNHHDAQIALLPAAMHGFRATPAVAAFAQQFRYFFFRSPKATQQILAGVVGGAFIGYQTVASRGLAIGTAVFVPLMALTLGLSTFNYDNRGYGYLMQTGTNLRRVLTGKVILNWLITTIVMTVFVVIEAAITDAWGEVTTAMLVGAGITTMATGVGALVGVTTPINQERPGGRKGRLLMGLLGGLVVIGTLFFGFAFLFGVFDGGDLGVGQGAISLAVGFAVGVIFLWLAGSRVERDPLAIAEALGV